MRIGHTGGYTPSERKQRRVVIFQTLINVFETILAKMDEHHIEFEDDKNLVNFTSYTLANDELTG
jgi:guanine nucleotide-binding protein subunit alpha